MSSRGDSQRKSLELAVIALGLTAFLALSLYQLNLPGPHYDEAKEAGLPAMQLLRGLPVDAFKGAAIRFGDRVIPLMVVDYIGATNVFLALPFLAIGGVHVVALRLLPVIFSVVALLLLYFFAREVYNRRVAGIAFLLLAVNPSFVFWSRQGVFVTSTIIPISLGAALCLLRWYRHASRGGLWVGMFLLGLGLYTKFLFLWVLVAFVLAFVIFEGRRLIRAVLQRRTSDLPYPLGWAEVIGGLLAFVAGILPLILYNLQTGGTIGVIGKNLTTSYYGTNNLAFWQNLSTRLDQLKAVLSGSHLWYLGGIFENWLWPYAAGAMLLGTVLAVIFRHPADIRRVALPWLVWSVIVLMSCFTVSALWPTHYAILIPWPPLALAVGLDVLWRPRDHQAIGFPANRIRRLKAKVGWKPTEQPSQPASNRLELSAWNWKFQVFWLLFVVALLLLDLRVDIAYHQALARSGGLAGHTSAIYELADTLEARGPTAPVAMDWGISAQVEFLTEGRVRPVEVFGYDWNADESFKERLKTFVNRPDSVYIFHAPAETVFPRQEAFSALVSDLGKVTLTETVIHQQDGKAMFTLVRVRNK